MTKLKIWPTLIEYDLEKASARLHPNQKHQPRSKTIQLILTRYKHGYREQIHPRRKSGNYQHPPGTRHTTTPIHRPPT